MATSRKPVNKKLHPTTGDLEEQGTMHQGLQRTDAYIKALMENALDGIVVLNRDGTIRYQSPFMERALGREQGEREGKNAFEFIHPDDLPKASNLFAELQQCPGATMFEEIRVLHQDGSVRTIEIVGQNLLDSPEVAGIVANLRDITERKQAEEALRESEEKYRSMVELCPDGIVVVGMDGVVEACNAALSTALGYSKSEIIGKHFSELPTAMSGDVPKFYETFDRLLGGAGPEPLELQWIHKDGSVHWGEIGIAPLEAQGTTTGFQAVVRDVTERRMVEDALRHSEDHFRALVENSSDVIVVLNRDGTIRYESPSMERFLGYEAGDRIGRVGFDFVHPDDIAAATGAFAELIAAPGSMVQLEARGLHKDGSWRILEIVYSNLADNPAVAGIVVNMRDVTERKRSEEALRASQAEHAALVANIADAVFRFKEGRLTWVNDRIQEMLGYTKDEMVGMDVNLFTSDDVDLKSIYEAVDAGLKERGLFHGTTRVKKKDGSVADVEYSASPIPGKDPIELVGIACDITERKRAEEALLIKDNAIEKSLTAIVITDIQGTITYVNEACLGLWRIAKREDVVGQSFWALLQLNADTANMITLSMIEHGQWQGDLTLTRRNGEQIDVQVLTAMVYDTHGKAIQTITSFMDVTERKNMEQQLQLAGRLAAIGELAAGVAHELNNPLTAVQAFAQFLADREDLDETARSDVETIYKEAQRATRITSSLLSFARKHNPEKSLISINDVIEKSVELHIYRMKVNNMDVVIELDPDLPMTMADFHQMQQVFANIITNAEQAMTEAHGRGKLVVKTHSAGAMIQATFTDDGPGIPKDNLSKLFDPFFTTKEVGEGTGLGLGICYGIMQEHGGRIYAESEAGEGATFVVEIPVVSELHATEETDSTHPLQSTPRHM